MHDALPIITLIYYMQTIILHLMLLDNRYLTYILIDELAHTNISRDRHTKRMDIEEILNHGIDVHTTLNIQHIETFKVVKLKFLTTGVHVKERVPNYFMSADVLAYTLTQQLIKRLKAGKGI